MLVDYQKGGSVLRYFIRMVSASFDSRYQSTDYFDRLLRSINMLPLLQICDNVSSLVGSCDKLACSMV